MASAELIAVTRELQATVSGLQAVADRGQKCLDYMVANNLNTELVGLASGTVIDGATMKKERVIDMALLCDTLVYFLRNVTNGSGQTALGQTPLNQASLTDKMKKTGI